ncbi:TPA: RtcB family protein [Candidatus Woesearchaeota archaeon]|nr:RtcB family protein [Candidatus Woesearchaeota archaeon]HIH31350.1 RtcB family protein [Candidatus Woesearchaeota archaeon]HIH54589.1 RtcB family protein [Candidatus Woesearchaeota archaeon]HIJ02357.1 RtcB family protein [Candidatus Woesearchaeota archaeon]HIJ14165.1 RtcB family protein [Candidatus Woesearchaeota archaeon]
MVQPVKINEFTWKIEKHGDMNVPAIVYSSDALMEKVKSDKTFNQIMNVACLKGIVKNAIAMPDCHEGYGFPIGGVAAFDKDDGIISPGGIGYDISCSVRLLRTDFNVDQILDKRKDFLDEIYKKVPVGTGRKGIVKITRDELMEILEKGERWAIDNGYGKHDDIDRTEENGHLDADPLLVSDRAIERGVPQLGTLGSGNHFLEMQKVDKIYDQKIAEAFGIYNEGQVVVMIHCGSRGLGHQVASDYIKSMEQKYGFENLPDRELINAPINSDLGQDYLKAMGAAANFAFTNKQLITYWVRQTFEKIYGNQDNIDVVYDVCHNIGKFEKHNIDGENRKVCVHRKGATRSFGPGREEIPEVYRDYGQPIIIPGSMGTASYVLVGTKKAEEVSFGSTAHGAGRVGSRSEALRTLRGHDIVNQLHNMNILVRGNSMKGIAEEAPQMYKDIDEVIRVSHGIGIGNMVARLKPLGVIKG